MLCDRALLNRVSIIPLCNIAYIAEAVSICWHYGDTVTTRLTASSYSVGIEVASHLQCRHAQKSFSNLHTANIPRESTTINMRLTQLSFDASLHHRVSNVWLNLAHRDWAVADSCILTFT